MAQHSHKAAVLNLQIHPVQHQGGHPLRPGIGKGEMFCFDNLFRHSILTLF